MDNEEMFERLKKVTARKTYNEEKSKFYEQKYHTILFHKLLEDLSIFATSLQKNGVRAKVEMRYPIYKWEKWIENIYLSGDAGQLNLFHYILTNPSDPNWIENNDEVDQSEQHLFQLVQDISGTWRKEESYLHLTVSETFEALWNGKDNKSLINDIFEWVIRNLETDNENGIIHL